MLSRRDVLRLLGGVCAVGTLSPSQLLAVSERVHRDLSIGPSALGFFDAHQMHTVAAACDRIIPDTDTPGARVAECHRFAERIVADHYPTIRQRRFLDGLVNLDVRSGRTVQHLFVDASAVEQDAILHAVEADTAAAAPASGSFWRDLKELTLIGYYTSRVGIDDELQVDFAPGRFDGCAPLDAGGR